MMKFTTSIMVYVIFKFTDINLIQVNLIFHYERLTWQGSLDSVLLNVLRSLGGVLAAGVGLVPTEGLPFLAQPVLVLQVVLHVALLA